MTTLTVFCPFPFFPNPFECEHFDTGLSLCFSGITRFGTMLQSLTRRTRIRAATYLSAINKYLSEYINEVSTDDLDVEFMNGDVVLRNVVPFQTKSNHK